MEQSKDATGTDKAMLLSAQYGVKVHTVTFEIDGNTVTAYLKEPNRPAKMRALDVAEKQGSASAGSILLEVCLLTEESDAAIGREDRCYFGACYAALQLIELAVPEFKKK